MRLPTGFQELIVALEGLPGVGQRTAGRYAFFLLDHADRAQRIARAVEGLAETVRLCRRCFHLAEAAAPDGLCGLCLDLGRDPDVLCVVETVPHLLAIERSGSFRGRYHVLHGALSPIKGIGPAALHIPELRARIAADGIREVIVATDVDAEGEATAAYLADALAPDGVRVTRIATGVPMGSDLEFLDGTTLARALAGRQ